MAKNTESSESHSRRKFLGAALAAAGTAAVTSPLWLSLLSDNGDQAKIPKVQAPENKKLKKPSSNLEFYPQELLDIYTNWLNICVKKKQQAGNKPFYIILCEDHYDPESFMFQTFLIDIALRLGLPNRMLEVDHEGVKVLQKEINTKRVPRGNMPLSWACDPRGDIIPIDTAEVPEIFKRVGAKINQGVMNKKTSLEFIEEEYKCHESREKQMVKTMLEHPEGGSVVIGLQHAHEVVEKLKEAGAEVAVFSGNSQEKLTKMADSIQTLINTLEESEKTPAVKWKYQEMEGVRKLGELAMLPPDKLLASRVRNNRAILLQVGKGMLETIGKAVGDLDVERDTLQIEERFREFKRQMLSR